LDPPSYAFSYRLDGANIYVLDTRMRADCNHLFTVATGPSGRTTFRTALSHFCTGRVPLYRDHNRQQIVFNRSIKSGSLFGHHVNRKNMCLSHRP
jgi:hypothetical protein